MADYCATCGASTARHRCGRCKHANYCSKDCQTAHWPAHKLLCKALVHSPKDLRPVRPEHKGTARQLAALLSDHGLLHLIKSATELPGALFALKPGAFLVLSLNMPVFFAAGAEERAAVLRRAARGLEPGAPAAFASRDFSDAWVRQNAVGDPPTPRSMGLLLEAHPGPADAFQGQKCVSQTIYLTPREGPAPAPKPPPPPAHASGCSTVRACEDPEEIARLRAEAARPGSGLQEVVMDDGSLAWFRVR